MFLLHRISPSRRVSREFLSIDCYLDSDSQPVMENTFIAPMPLRKRAVTEVKRHSRMPSLFFGNKGNGEAVETLEDISRTTSRTSIPEQETTRFFFGTRRRLKKSTSKLNLSSAILESPREEEREGRREKKPTTPKRESSKFNQPISEPYNFSHLGHIEQGSMPAPKDWRRVVRDSKLSRHSREDMSQPSSPSRVRSTSTLSRSNSTAELPPIDLINSAPIPPARKSSRQILHAPSVHEDIPEDFIDPDTIGIATPLDEDMDLPHAITTDGDYVMGQKSPGVEKLFFIGEPEQMTPQEESPVDDVSRIDLRKAMSTPDISTIARESARQRANTVVRTVTSNPGPFVNNGRASPLRRVRTIKKRSSRRISVSFKLTPPMSVEEKDDANPLDFWEDVIDYSYSKEAECYSDYAWETSSVCSDSLLERSDQYDSHVPFEDIPSPLGAIDEEVQYNKSFAPERLTCLFEDKLLLPGTPLSARFPFPDSSTIGLADGGFDIPSVEDTDIIFRSAETTLRHRSIKSSSSLQEMVPAARVFREELSRCAKQLDSQLQSLHSDAITHDPKTVHSRDTRLRALNNGSAPRQGRPRTDSDTTCITMCSDSDAFSHTESAEAITPALSTQSSFSFINSRSSSVLSFEAAPAKEGVIEYAPHTVQIVGADEVHFNYI